MDMTSLIREIISFGGAIILRNEWGTTELKGDDFILRESSEWITIYHASCDNPEIRSHLHLRKDSFSHACIIENDGYTPQMAFWVNEDKSDAIGPAAKPSFAIYFPSFYDWTSGNKEPIDKNQDLYHHWIKNNPKHFIF